MDKSKWSSFEEDEEFTDAWREFLEEGVWDNIKTGVRAGTQAYRGAKVAGRSAARDAKRTLGGEVDSVTQGMGGKGRSSATDATDATDATAAAGPAKPVNLFTGQNSLYSKLFSTIMSRFNNKSIQGQKIKLDKAQVQNTVKQILKDLSAQLRASGMKVQESHIPTMADLIMEELENANILEAQYTSAQTAGSDGGNKTATGARVAPKQGQVDAGRAVGGKIVALVGQAAGIGDGDDRDLRKMVTSDIQQDLKVIIMKIVKPHLQQYLQGTNIKLRESEETVDEQK
jgi:hypothetical protein